MVPQALTLSLRVWKPQLRASTAPALSAKRYGHTTAAAEVWLVQGDGFHWWYEGQYVVEWVCPVLTNWLLDHHMLQANPRTAQALVRYVYCPKRRQLAGN